jgi:hypothetical protein
MDINLSGITRALSHLGIALDEVRAAVQRGEAGIVRFRTEDRSVELPLGLAMAGVAVLVVLTAFRNVPDRGADIEPAIERDRRLMEASRAHVAG